MGKFLKNKTMTATTSRQKALYEMDIFYLKKKKKKKEQDKGASPLKLQAITPMHTAL